MRTVQLLVISSLLTACGMFEKPKSSNDSTPLAPKDNAYYIASTNDLPTCGDAIRGELYYIQQNSQFEACETAGWVVVDLKGKDGSSGKDGSNGTNGVNGANGTNASNNPIMTAEEWFDPITNKIWTMTSLVISVTQWDNGQSTCTGSYRMPTGAEFNAALNRGLRSAILNLPSPPAQIIASDGAYSTTNGTLGSMTNASQFCIQQ